VCDLKYPKIGERKKVKKHENVGAPLITKSRNEKNFRKVKKEKKREPLLRRRKKMMEL
jgi:hypothetical protein